MSPEPINPTPPGGNEDLLANIRARRQAMRDANARIRPPDANDYTKHLEKIVKDLEELDGVVEGRLQKDSEQIKKITQRLSIQRQLSPSVWAAAASSRRELFEKYEDISFAPSQITRSTPGYRASYLERVKGLGIEARSPEFQSLLGESISPSASQNIGGELMSRGLEGEVSKISKDFIEMNAQRTAGLLTESAYARKVEDLKNKYAVTLNVVRELNKNKAEGVQLADKETERIKAGASAGYANLRRILPAAGARTLDAAVQSPSFQKIFGNVEAEEKAAGAGRKDMAPMASAASQGMDKIASSLQQILSISKMASIAMIAVGKFIEALDEARKVQGAAIPALAAGAGNMGIGYQKFAMDVLNSNDAIFDSLKYTDQFVPLVTASFSAMATIGNTSNRHLESGNRNLARSLMEVGLAGKGMGMEFGQSMGMAAQFTKALNLGEHQVGKYFKEYIALSKIARLSMDDFGKSIGDVMEYSKMFGEEGAKRIVADMAVMTKNLGPAQQQVAMGALRSMANMDLTRQVGMVMAANNGSSASIMKLQRAMAGGANGPGVLGVMTESVGAMMQQVSAGLKGDDVGRRLLGMASAAEQLMGPGMGKALFAQGENFEQSELYRVMMGQSDKTPKEIQKLIDDMQKQFDPQRMGAEAMTKNTDTLTKIFNLLENTFRGMARSVLGSKLGLNIMDFASDMGETGESNALLKYKKTP